MNFLDGELTKLISISGNRILLALTTGFSRRLGVPDRYVEHADRDVQLAELGLDFAGIVKACQEMAERSGADRAAVTTRF